MSRNINDQSESNRYLCEIIRNIYENSIEIENELIYNESGSKLRKKVEIDILLIEDDIVTIRMLKRLFYFRGINLTGVVSGSQAFELRY